MGAGKSPIILVADADRLMRWAIVEWLSQEGYMTWEVSEPTQAQDYLRSGPDLAMIQAATGNLGLFDADGLIHGDHGSERHAVDV